METSYISNKTITRMFSLLYDNGFMRCFLKEKNKEFVQYYNLNEIMIQNKITQQMT
jgi:hypothetical protein